MSSERPFPWGGWRGKNLSSLRHASSTALWAYAHRWQATHQHNDNRIRSSEPLARRPSCTATDPHSGLHARHPICTGQLIFTATHMPMERQLYPVHLHIISRPHVVTTLLHGDPLARQPSCTVIYKHGNTFARQPICTAAHLPSSRGVFAPALAPPIIRRGLLTVNRGERSVAETTTTGSAATASLAATTACPLPRRKQLGRLPPRKCTVGFARILAFCRNCFFGDLP